MANPLVAINMHVVGAGERARALKNTKDKKVKAFKRGLRKGGVHLRAAVKKNTPVRTGAARGSVRYTTKEFTVKVFSQGVKYVPFLEHGTRYMRAFRMFRKAFRSERPAVVRIVKAEVDKA